MAERPKTEHTVGNEPWAHSGRELFSLRVRAHGKTAGKRELLFVDRQLTPRCKAAYCRCIFNTKKKKLK